MAQIIGISGKMGSGKDTVAEIFAEKGYKVVKFSDSLKKVVSIIAGVEYPSEGSEEEMRAWKSIKVDKYSKTMGEMLQIVGTSMRQNIHPGVWVYIALKKAEQSSIVVADVRYQNEANAIKKRGGILIRLERAEKERLGVVEGDSTDLAHPSETELDDYLEFDYVIHNNQSLADLKEMTLAILSVEEARGSA